MDWEDLFVHANVLFATNEEGLFVAVLVYIAGLGGVGCGRCLLLFK